MKNRQLIPLAAIFAAWFSITNSQNVCSVTESENVFLNTGACKKLGQVDPAKCKSTCQRDFGANVLDSECTMDHPNAHDDPACVCKLKCISGGSTGDPHYWSFDWPAGDGNRYDLMSLKKHYLIKPCSPYTTMPNFEVRQTNRPYSGLISVVDNVEIVIPEWERVIQITAPQAGQNVFQFLVNGITKNLPYYHAPTRRGFEFVKVDYKDPGHTQVVLETSFGLRVTIAWAYAVVDIPMHPELMKKACGILGTPNGNFADDCKFGPNGAPCQFELGFDPQAVKNTKLIESWVVPGTGAWAAGCFPPEEQKEFEEFVNNIDPGTIKQIEELCKANFGNQKFIDCQKKLGLPVKSVDECIFDAKFMRTDAERKEVVKQLIKAAAVHCDVEIPFVVPPPQGGGAGGCCMKNLGPLYKMYRGTTDDHFYTPEFGWIMQATRDLTNSYQPLGTAGFVAKSKDDCSCGAKASVLKPVYQLWKEVAGKKGSDHFYTTGPIEADKMVKEKGYGNHGIHFYCAGKQGECGATVPLYRVLRPTNQHYYTTDEAEYKKLLATKGHVDEDILCFVWPEPPEVKH